MSVTDAHPAIERTLEFFPVQNAHPRKFTRPQVRQFNERGFIFLLDVFALEEADANRVYFDDLMIRAEAKGHNSYSVNGWHCAAYPRSGYRSANLGLCTGFTGRRPYLLGYTLFL